MIDHEHYWNGQKIWNGKITKPVEKNYKIALCITCMNRLQDLSLTFPYNINNETYPDVEFIVLDYNSKEPLNDWAKPYVESGKLTYYRTTDPQFYSMAHSRNVAFTLANADIVINLDADNYLQMREEKPKYTFCEYVNLLANQCDGKKGIFAKGKRLIHGRLGCFKKEFMDIGGYDEDFMGYGYDDTDLLRRLWAKGCELYWFGGIYIERIKTHRWMKGQYMKNKNWRETEKLNKEIGWEKFDAGLLERNTGKPWAKCQVIKNFNEELQVENL
jgi:glycosyltransferase involved in cell wall biosynthesis